MTTSNIFSTFSVYLCQSSLKQQYYFKQVNKDNSYFTFLRNHRFHRTGSHHSHAFAIFSKKADVFSILPLINVA